jgi:hypothetical protein
MLNQEEVPRWLWRVANWGMLAAVVAVLGLAGALALGLADPPRAGPLLWQDDFKHGTQRWTLAAPDEGTLSAADGALAAVFADSSVAAGPGTVGLTSGPDGDYTLEVAGTAVSGESVAAYGLVFDWQDDQHYSALFVDGNGYAEAYQQAGPRRVVWFQWQQWPNILFGTGTNRLRVDVRGQAVNFRINDEVLAAGPRAAARGQIGVAARSSAAARVVFSWVKVWASS